MILITTHQGADFDSYAGVLAASLLHPGAVLSFPGSKEPALRAYLEAEAELTLPELRTKDVNLDQVRSLVLVDTVSAERIGPFAKLLDPPGRVHVVCYDHHPDNDPPPGAELHVRAVGAVATLLCSLLEERGIPLTPAQATLMALGIYEDTGGLLHAGTTPEDLRAVARLVELGADLGRVARTLARVLTPLQVELYHEILHGARTCRCKGREVVLAVVATDAFVPDASVVVQQYVQATGASRFAALLRMQERIFLIVRSRAADLNASHVAAAFGGGGHAWAASAVLHGRTLIEAQDAVLRAIDEALVPSTRAVDLATPILYTVESEASVDEAVRLLNRYRVNALPVMEGARVVGALTRQLADAALHHGMRERRVRDLVVAEVDVVPPEADVELLRARLLRGTARFILVGEEGGKIRGIVTRTALLRHLYEEHADDARQVREISSEGEDVTPLIAKSLPPASLDVLRAVGSLAEARGMSAYLVGGGVRDLLLRREIRDLDVVIEGDACALARELAGSLGARARVHEAFQTAALLLHAGGRVDLATARTEHYRSPAALPEVSPGGIRQDLFRRDFTINALAVRLTSGGFGRVLDFFGSRKDLAEGKIRVLHGLSFIEDPTRAFRAVRFATELGFEISRETAHLVRVATHEQVFDRLSPARLRRELEQLLGSRRPLTAVRMLEEMQLLPTIHPRLGLGRRTQTRLERLEEALAWHRLSSRPPAVAEWAIVLGVMTEGLDTRARAELVERLRPGRGAASVLRTGVEEARAVLASLGGKRALRPSQVVEACRGKATEIVLLAMALCGREELRRVLALYLSELRGIRPDITGEDLIRAGVPEGPRIALGLEAALRAKLDGRAPERTAQLEEALEAVGQA